MTATDTVHGTRWEVVALGFASGVVGMFQTAKVSLALPQVQGDIGLDLLTASWAITAVSLTGALFGIQAGRVSEEFGVVRALVAALILSAVAGLATAVLSDPLPFLVARVVEGIGYLLVCAAAPAMMAAFAAPGDRGLALAIWGAFVPVSVALMSLAGPPVVVGAGWRTLFAVTAALSLLMAAWVALRVRDDADARGGAARRLRAVLRSIPTDIKVLYASPASLGLGVAFMAFAATQVGFIALQPVFLIEARGVSLPTAGLVLAATTPFSIAGTAIASVLARRGLPEIRVVGVGFLVLAMAGGAFFAVGSATGALVAVGAAFFTAGGVVGSVLFASLPRRATAAAGVALLSGLLVQFGNIGALLGAPILAGVAAAWTWSAAPAAMAAMAAVGFAGALASQR